jgi:multimeric flavodoxin WrbA
MKVVAFNGSPRKNGNTSILIGHVFEELKKEGIQTELIQVGGNLIHGCRACMECAKRKNKRCAVETDPVNDWIQKMEEADGIIFGSPTYVTDVTAELKAVIDRTCYVTKMNGDFLKRKVGAAVVAVRRAGAVHVFDTINHFFSISQMVICTSRYWNLGIGREIGDVNNDAEGIDTMKVLGQNMAWLLKKINL